jgi:predicted Zn-dependent protease
MIIFKVDGMLREEDFRKVEVDIRRQLPTGIVVVPACVEVTLTPPDDSGCVVIRTDGMLTDG